MGRLADRQTHIQADLQTSRLAFRQNHGPADMQAAHMQMGRLADGQTNGWMDRLTDRRMNGQKDE